MDNNQIKHYNPSNSAVIFCSSAGINRRYGDVTKVLTVIVSYFEQYGGKTELVCVKHQQCKSVQFGADYQSNLPIYVMNKKTMR